MSARVQLLDGFQEFWTAYPRKVGKLDAIKAYAKARTVATAAELLAGVEAYIKHKPAYADWCHPSSWLNKGRWMDEYEDPGRPSIYWWEECQALHGGTCVKRWDHETRKQNEAATR